jgi:hypothetical protein
MRIVCWILKATNTHSDYAIIIALNSDNGCTYTPQIYSINILPVLIYLTSCVGLKSWLVKLWPLIGQQFIPRITKEWIYITVGMILIRRYKIIGKTCTSTICPPQLPSGVAWNWFRGSALYKPVTNSLCVTQHKGQILHAENSRNDTFEKCASLCQKNCSTCKA